MIIIGVVDHDGKIIEIIDWDRDAVAAAAIERARQADPDGTMEDWEEVARDDPEARIERPDAARLIDMTANPGVRVGWTFDRGYLYPPQGEG